MKGDGAVRRVIVQEMTDEQLDALLLTIRERRLSIVRAKQEAEMAKRSVYIDHLREKLNKQLQMLEKELTSVDKALDKAEARVLKIRAIRLEAEG